MSVREMRAFSRVLPPYPAGCARRVALGAARASFFRPFFFDQETTK